MGVFNRLRKSNLTSGAKKMYIRKTIDEYQIHVNYGYGHGYEHEVTEFTRKDAKQRLKEYQDNCPQYHAKIVKKRVLKSI